MNIDAITNIKASLKGRKKLNGIKANFMRLSHTVKRLQLQQIVSVHTTHNHIETHGSNASARVSEWKKDRENQKKRKR